MHSEPPSKFERAERSTPRERVLAKAICSLVGGDTRVLYVTKLTSTYAYIRTLRPPPLATTLSMIIQPIGRGPLPPISARVVGTDLDPGHPYGCGFRAAFTSMGVRSREMLCEALVHLGLRQDPVPEPQDERRVEPRVWTDLQPVARLGTPSGVRTAQVVNVSLGGALLAFDEAEDLSEILACSVIPVDISVTDVPEVLSLRASVVRRTGPGEPYGIAIRFVDVEPATRARIETILLYLLGEFFDGFRIQ
jgi:hypothetical protein